MSAAIIGLITSALSAAGGAVTGIIQGAKNDRIRNEMRKENQSFYDMMKTEDYLGNKRNQAALNEGAEYMKDAIAQARATEENTGGTPGTVAKAINGVTNTMGGVMREIASQETERQDRAALAYHQEKQQLNAEDLKAAQQTSANIAKAMSTGVTAGLSAIGSAMNSSDGKTPAMTQAELDALPDKSADDIIKQMSE